MYKCSQILALGLLLLASTGPNLACGLAMDPDDSEGFGEELALDPETGKPLLGLPPAEGKADGYNGPRGPKASGLSSTTEVWKVTTRWYKTDPAAGMAWSANSDLTWDEKYAAWVKSLKKTTAHNGYSKTFTLSTPWGKTLPSPALECAEAGMFLRATFASWYNLPFFMEAYSPTHGRIYFGHFGVVSRSGARVSGTPRYKSSYKDHTSAFAGKSDQQIQAAWPKDSNLGARYLTKAKDDENHFLGQDAYSGAYFDEIFLNKRVGYFLLRLLTNLGSMHVAHTKNTFNLVPEALREGDVLVERWQRQGIGHVMVIKNVTKLSGGNMDAEIVYGSMPRIQPKWYSPSLSKSYFTSNYSGGVGTNSDGDAYAALGGGLKRWRTPVVKYGSWYNIIPVRDRDNHINANDLEAISKRPARFQEMLGNLSPEEQRDVYLQQIDNARENLRLKPASCANRQRREEAFDKLYKLNQDHFSLSKEQTDKQYRKLEDYVLAELDYTKSKTCCWNSTTKEMYDLIMEYNKKHVHDATAQTYKKPVVFKAVDGGYQVFKDYAVSVGKGNLWVDWSEDETCPQASDASLTDTETSHAWTDFLVVAADILGHTSTSGGNGSYVDGQPCNGVTWEGLCDGNTVVWCQNEEINTYTCTSGSSCAWYEGQEYYWCL